MKRSDSRNHNKLVSPGISVGQRRIISGLIYGGFI